ncbi:hypothetical protein D6C90_05251 [Aureobasidium pullulans]|uniref:Uncharacterized protein n=1 Tax=Aureobasidium pullulans TaxID=5580 RepID=A0A4S9GHN2_AURPU|nr:hypothetical protein D6D08_08646 [Aureobasidium pullulans]THZ42624.1 hypothetical protein D6C90_05251 [Aureobasidium pullulans]
MPSHIPHYMLPTISSQTSARAATRAVVAPVSANVRSKQITGPVKALPPRPALRPTSSAIPAVASKSTFSARQKALKPVAPRPSALTAADRNRLKHLAPAVQEELAKAREVHCGEIRKACEYRVAHGEFSFESSGSEWSDSLLGESDDESECTVWDIADLVMRSFDSEYDTVIIRGPGELEDERIADAESLSFVEVSPSMLGDFADYPYSSVPSPPLSQQVEDDLVVALEELNLDEVRLMGLGSDSLFSPLHSSFLSRHPSFLFLEDS